LRFFALLWAGDGLFVFAFADGQFIAMGTQVGHGLNAGRKYYRNITDVLKELD
jgi:hypothetical protein